jgi:hypothetical protein
VANFYDDVERMAHIKMIAAIANSDSVEFNPNVIDKVALFNGIEKSYPPDAKKLAQDFIEGANFIMFLAKTSNDWSNHDQPTK